MPTFEFELGRLLSYDNAALLAELCRVAALVESPYLTQGDFDKHSKASSSVVRRRFGGWKQALTRAGLEDRFSGGAGGRGNKVRTFTDDELLSELRVVSEKVGGVPVTVDLFNQHANVNAETLRRRFGSWWAALKKASLPISNRGKRYSDGDYFENLLSVWTYYGRQPKYGEMNEAPSCIPSGAYQAKWGTWTKALLAFLERVNADLGTPTETTESSLEETRAPCVPRRRTGTRRVKQEDQRQIKLGLRYEVLKRDHFRCVLCGASPATHLGCVLHVDHMIPYSRGGRTIAANLRTLCEACNLGKSARLETER
jgi:hypothetical protein